MTAYVPYGWVADLRTAPNLTELHRVALDCVINLHLGRPRSDATLAELLAALAAHPAAQVRDLAQAGRERAETLRRD